MTIEQIKPLLLVCKAKQIESHKWVEGYPVRLKDGRIIFYVDGVEEQIIDETICYSTKQPDKNGRILFIGDTINDFGGGVYETDYNHPDYHPHQAFPPTKCTGDKTRLGNIVFEDGTVRIETAEMNYCYNISNGSRLRDMEYHSNVWDNIYPEKQP